MTNENWTKLDAGNVFKLENDGDSVTGYFKGIKESGMYAGSFAVDLQDTETKEIKTVFVSNIVSDIIAKNEIQKDDLICVELKEWLKSQQTGMKYKNFVVHKAQ